jgi:hypothetical protein
VISKGRGRTISCGPTETKHPNVACGREIHDVTEILEGGMAIVIQYVVRMMETLPLRAVVNIIALQKCPSAWAAEDVTSKSPGNNEIYYFLWVLAFKLAQTPAAVLEVKATLVLVLRVLF